VGVLTFGGILEVTLGQFKVKLVKPASFMVARDVGLAMQKNALRGLVAALAACWGGKPLKATLAGSGYDACAWGGAVFDELMALGIPEEQIYEAAGEALRLLTGGPTEEGVARAAGFSEAPTGA